MQKLMLLFVICLSINNAYAESIKYGKITSPKQFQHYWGLTPEQMEQYENYMNIAGKFRHTNSNPLVVLSIISDDDEDKDYFANKAARYESDMSKREILSSWLISSAMEKQKLSDAMQTFSDQLTGINSQDYIPENIKTDWKERDELIILIDKVCFDTHCLSQFTPLLKATPLNIIKKIIYKNTGLDESQQKTITQSLSQLKNTYKDILINKYDRIEHGFLSNLQNQAVQVRQNQIIRKF
ncbi:hypothetical protein QJU23_03625 [Pasteurella atlantica]|uniref:Uncharacterized protein n=2 Tax=Pasteurellaceae TaxID=712 RepID=A0ACC6HKV2_9PAST|nr:hypothetical protein [Pasteurella atlantica]MDP8051516.1 hypothetical protein [Pasteurella atlantica]MDP8104905.1 hypothetical protein [Pasteurella atlantica]MDP8148279.1 hypothetical protein [Pasteurella atlantica]